jgi:hypothetical protein
MSLPHPVQLEDGLFYYILPQGYKLFRGDNSLYFDQVLPLKLTFFSIAPGEVEQYGMVFEFELQRPYNLLALDHPVTKEILHESAPIEMRNIMENNYGFHTMRRNSVGEKDRRLSGYLCENGFEGYATNEMLNVEDAINDFHVEVVVCDPSHVRMVKQITPENKRVFKIDEVKLRQHGKEQDEKRQRGSKPFRGDIPKFRMFYNEENDDDGDHDKPIIRRLFGGKRSKINRKSLKLRRSSKLGRSLKLGSSSKLGRSLKLGKRRNSVKKNNKRKI